jgi:MAM domain, meprin/A5/mu
MVLAAEYGWYMNMMATDSRPGFTARLETHYMKTTDMCVELFFQTTSSSRFDISTVSVLVVSEDKLETALVSSKGNEPPMWNRLFTTLPSGINRVVITGRRSSSGFSSVSIDDVAIFPCTMFGNVCLLKF